MIEYESRTARLATPSENSKYESVGECFMIQPINLIDAAILRLTLSLSIILLMWQGPAPPYVELSELVRYEHVKANADDPQFAAALAKLDADDQSRQRADFTLTDLQRKAWTLQALRGKVVLVNFWATWCDPCRREMPDLEALYRRFKNQGLVVLAISDDDAGKVKQLIVEKRFTYPVLLDPGRKVTDLFRIEGIPKSFVYDRDGKLVAQAIDMRTRGQFLEMLAQAGLH